MTKDQILHAADHTLLKPFATWEQICKICDESILYHTASICIPPCYVKRVHETYKDAVNICTVVGFPLGYETTEGKIADAVQCIADGANEIDMVINISDVKNGDYSKVCDEIAAMKKACGNHILKVIIETCYLTNEEKIAMCKAVTDGGADYIKTSTGFGTKGAVLSDIALFKENIGPNVKIKAAGGIRTKEDLIAFLEAGCDRLGTSAAVSVLANEK